MRCCSAAGRLPISGKAAPSGAAPVSESCRRVSVKSAISDGIASEMIDGERAAPSPDCGIASKAAAASMSASGRSVGAADAGACAEP